MPQPKKRLSHTRSGNRRSHHALDTQMSVQCSHCQATLAPHTVCASCGYYKNQLVLPKSQVTKAHLTK